MIRILVRCVRCSTPAVVQDGHLLRYHALDVREVPGSALRTGICRTCAERGHSVRWSYTVEPILTHVEKRSIVVSAPTSK